MTHEDDPTRLSDGRGRHAVTTGGVPFYTGGNGHLRPHTPYRPTTDPIADPSLGVQPISPAVHAKVKAEGHCSNHGGNLWTSADPMDMAVALGDCRGCPVKAECLEVVQPRRSWFDGVAGGRAWLDGCPVDVAVMGRAPLNPEIPLQQVDEAEPDLLLSRLKGLRPPRPEGPS